MATLLQLVSFVSKRFFMLDLLTVPQLAQKLQVSKWTVYAWVSQKYIPYFKLRGLVRFRADAVEKWLLKNQSEGRSLHRLKIEETHGQHN